MRSATKLHFEKLQQAPLLERCGHTDDSEFVFAKHKSEAWRHLRTAKWNSFRLMLNNRRYSTLSKLSYPRFQSWNVVAAELRPFVFALSEEIISRTAWSLTERKDAKKNIEWDIITTLLEVEFADVMAPLFNVSRILPIYEAGHLPCGWTGHKIDERWAGASIAPVPDGTVMVY